MKKEECATRGGRDVQLSKLHTTHEIGVTGDNHGHDITGGRDSWRDEGFKGSSPLRDESKVQAMKCTKTARSQNEFR